jgi:hypothetical protein
MVAWRFVRGILVEIDKSRELQVEGSPLEKEASKAMKSRCEEDDAPNLESQALR